MTENNNKLSDVEIGERLRLSREATNITQAAAADAIGAARTTIVAIEQGKRKIRIDELQKLTKLYNTSANAILRREAIHVDMVPRFRKLIPQTDAAVEDASRLLNDLVRAEVELENVLGVMRRSNFPPERPILPGDVYSQAEQDAQELRNWLGLGPGPVVDIISILSLQMGLRVYIRSLDARISGLFAFDNATGGSVLLNANHPTSRLKQTAAHELGHFISARRTPEVYTENEQFVSREERYANAFQRCFLTPAREIRQRFAEITAGQTHLTRRHVILLAYTLGISREAMVRRLEELKLAKDGTWDWFSANGGITDEQVHQVIGSLPDHNQYSVEAQQPVPQRISLLAREAWKREIYSEGQLARLLQLDRHEIRELLDGVEMEQSEANDLVKLSR